MRIRGNQNRVPHSQNRVAHPFASFAKGWVIALRATAFLACVPCASLLTAQSTCDISSITETSQLVYPPIGRAAHIAGTVILLTRFDTNGVPVQVNVLNGPPMLQGAALDFVKGFRANEYSGPRECPIIVTFSMIQSDKPVCSYEEAGAPRFNRVDFQHASISTHPVAMCDTAITITRTKHRWLRKHTESQSTQ